MRATTMGLTGVALLLAGSVAHAQPAFLVPPAGCVPCNPTFYTAGACRNCWYGPNYCFQGACLPPSPFNGMVTVPKEQALQGGYPGMAPGLQGYGPPPAGPASFATHPFARSPRDYFMYGQQWTE